MKFTECITVTSSEVSASWFRIERLSLTSSFAEFGTPVSYPANYNGHKVGSILSNGVAISVSDLKQIVKPYYTCIQLSDTYVKETDMSLYEIYDFGRTIPGSKTVEVQQLPVYINGSYICAYITPQAEEEIYFAVKRIGDVNERIQYFSDATIIQLYILSGLFLICSIYGISILGIVTYQIIKGMQEFKIQLFVVLVCLFTFNISNIFHIRSISNIIVRCVYFFLVPNGIYNPISDYAMVAFPTFLYFTAFSQIVVIW